MINYSIGITTYDYRFNKYLIPLIDSIKNFRPNIDIILAINGNYKESFNECYRRDILSYCCKHNNIFPIVFPQFRGLSKLWNSILIHSTTDKILMLNDDITINSSMFFDDLEKHTHRNIFKINSSWSHYFTSRNTINDIGWFDERLLGMGEEDGDFEFRYGTYYKTNFPNIEINNIINHVEYDGACKNMRKVFGKYTAFNRYFMFNEKYEINKNEGKIYGITNVPLVCKNNTPKQYIAEKFFWDNIDSL